MTEYHIHVEGWDKFQHYKDRTPHWIKLYVDLHHNDDFMLLTPVQRSTLFGIWIEYAWSGGKLHKNTRELSRKLGMRVTVRTLDALVQAGFIRIAASGALSQRREEEKREEEESAPPMKPLEALPDLRAWKVGA